MNLRKLLAGAAALVMAGSMLTACSDDKDDDKESKKEKTSSVQTESKSDDADTTTTTVSAEEPEEPAKEVKQPEKVEIPQKEIKDPKLKEVGKITDEKVHFTSDLVYTGESEEDVECLDYLGKPISGGGAVYVDKLDNTGLFAYYKKGGDILYEGLIDAQGNELVSPDQKVGLFSALNDRYLIAYFPEATTTNEDEAIYYMTSSQFSFMPDEGDVLYTGTVKLYDIANKKFIESTTEHFAPNYHANGDIISYYGDNDEVVYVDAVSDKVVELDGYSDLVAGKYFVVYEDSKYDVYDKDKSLVYVSDYNIMGYDETSYYLKFLDSDTSKYGLLNINFEQVLDAKYKYINYLDENLFTYCDNDSSLYGLLGADGKELTQQVYSLISKTDSEGYYYGKKENGKYDLFDSTGKVVDTDNADGYYGFASKKADDGYATLVLDTGEFSIKSSSALYDLGNNIGYDSKENILYNMKTGETLAEGFDKAYTAYGYIYVQKDKEVTVYEVE